MGTRVRRPKNIKPTAPAEPAPVAKEEPKPVKVQPKLEPVREQDPIAEDNEESKSPMERRRRGKRIEDSTEAND